MTAALWIAIAAVALALVMLALRCARHVVALDHRIRALRNRVDQCDAWQVTAQAEQAALVTELRTIFTQAELPPTPNGTDRSVTFGLPYPKDPS